jgi:hypothetical protein
MLRQRRERNEGEFYNYLKREISAIAEYSTGNIKYETSDVCV